MLVRRVPESGCGAALDAEASDLVGLAAIVFVAAEHPATVAELSEQVGAPEAQVAEAGELLLSSSWLVEDDP